MKNTPSFTPIDISCKTKEEGGGRREEGRRGRGEKVGNEAFGEGIVEERGGETTKRGREKPNGVTS